MFYTSKWFEIQSFSRILMKSPIELHTGRFWKIFESLTLLKPPKFTFYCNFKEENLAECVVLWVKKADFVLLGSNEYV